MSDEVHLSDTVFVARCATDDGVELPHVQAEPTVTLTHSELAAMIGQAVALATDTDPEAATAAALEVVTENPNNPSE